MEQIQCSDFMKKRILLIFVLLLIVVSTVIYSQTEQVQVLIIKDIDTAKETVIPVKEGTFTLKFIHSIHLTPVYEIYTISSGQMVLKETRFYSLGVGMPYTQEEGIFENADGQFRITGLNRKCTSLQLQVSPIPKHAIIIDGCSYPLLNLAEPEDRIIITADERRIFPTNNVCSGPGFSHPDL